MESANRKDTVDLNRESVLEYEDLRKKLLDYRIDLDRFVS
jgi:hypothetical protein